VGVFSIILGGYLIFTAVKISYRSLRGYIVMAYLILQTISSYNGVDNIHALINGFFCRNFFISFSSLSYDRSKASSKASSPHNAIQSFLLQMRISSPFLKVIQ